MDNTIIDKYLKEASLSRIWKHLEAGRPFGMLTAFRGDYSKKDNLARNKKMEAGIRSAGYGFFRMEGHYIEGYGSDEAQDVKEQSFFVIGEPNDNETLKTFLRLEGKKFDQDSIFYYDPATEQGYLIGTNAQGWPGLNKEVSVGKWHPSKAGEFYSKMKRQTFVFETVEQPPNILSLVNDKTLREMWWSHLRED
jgi:hypothetical protein